MFGRQKVHSLCYCRNIYVYQKGPIETELNDDDKNNDAGKCNFVAALQKNLSASLFSEYLKI